MSSWGERLATRGHQLDSLSGVAQDPKAQQDPVPITYSGFGGGINTSDSPEDVPENTAIYAADMEVDRDDSLIPAPGFTQLASSPQGTTGPVAAFQQASLDYEQELVLIFGNNGGQNWAYYDKNGTLTPNLGGLSNNGPHGWNACSIAGSLIASNGLDFTGTRASGAGAFVDITAQIIAARGFALQFGRAFAVGVTPAAGTYQALGVSWNGSSGSISDWTGANSGSQLLIGAEADADACMGVAPLGFDLLVIVNRHSIWFGYPTGIANAPADFRPRTLGVGTPYGNTVASTPIGVMFLSDEGVMLVTPTGVNCISDDVNPSILPLSYTGNPDTYSAIWSPARNRYILRTPTGLWIYTIPGLGTYSAYSQQAPAGRWTFRSALVDAIVEYSNQNVSYAGLTSPTTLWVIKTGVSTSKVGTELYTGVGFTDSYFGTAYIPTWRMPFAAKDSITTNYITTGFEIEYVSTAPVTISMQLTDPTGQPLGSVVTKVLPSSGGALAKNNIPYIGTGLGPSIQLKYVAWPNNAGATSIPVCRIKRIRQAVVPAGSSLSSL